jgi:hypothetical protein
MRPIVFGVLLVLPAFASAQTQTDPAAAKEPAASIITLDDLQGVTITTTNSFTARFADNKGEAPGGYTLNREIRIGPKAAVQIKFSRDAWWDSPTGRRTGHLSGARSGTIGLPMEAGGGASLFLLEGNTLTQLRVYEVGAQILKVTLEKSAAGLTCKASNSLAQERGAGTTRVPANEGGGSNIEVWNVKPTSSSCRVSRTK